jgi:undecaprenyl-diphosphatase
VTVNYQLFELLNHEAGRIPWLDDLMVFAATRLIYAVFAVAAVLVAVAVARRQTRTVVQLRLTLVPAFSAATVSAHLGHQVRPFKTHRVHQLIAHHPGVSLPSDHATAVFALAFGVGMFLHRGWGALLTVAALIIGLSRVWVGVHYPGDVLATA